MLNELLGFWVIILSLVKFNWRMGEIKEEVIVYKK